MTIEVLFMELLKTCSDDKEICNQMCFFHNVMQRDEQTTHFGFFITSSVLQNIYPQQFSHDNVFVNNNIMPLWSLW